MATTKGTDLFGGAVRFAFGALFGSFVGFFLAMRYTEGNLLVSLIVTGLLGLTLGFFSANYGDPLWQWLSGFSRWWHVWSAIPFVLFVAGICLQHSCSRDPTEDINLFITVHSKGRYFYGPSKEEQQRCDLEGLRPCLKEAKQKSLKIGLITDDARTDRATLDKLMKAMSEHQLKPALILYESSIGGRL